MARAFARETYRTNLPAVTEFILAQAAGRAMAVGNAIRTQIVNGMAQPHAGRRYLVPGTRRYYTASAPGEYPAIRTGALRSSVKTVFIVNRTQATASALTGTHLPYGMYLELGTKRMAPRPWLSRGYIEARAAIDRILARPWRQGGT